MAQLKDKIQNALDEARMLVLGSQVLLGFQFRSAFEPGFPKLPPSSQYLKLAALGLMLVALGLLLAPGVAGDFYVVVRKITESNTSAIAAALVSLLFFYGLWFGLTRYRRGRERSGPESAEHEGRQFAS
ncbi:MAG TPA: DUF6328 family protein [Pyrinomonadaceae bacterium]|nr:DUF6328 family protein [Pyrinomonadaceae bacterium]